MSSDRTPADEGPWLDAGGQRLRCGDLVAYLNPDPAMRYVAHIRALIIDDGNPYVVMQGHPLVDGNDDVPCSMVALIDELALAAAGYRVTPKPDDTTVADEQRPNRCPTCDSRAPQYALSESDCDPLAGGVPDPWHVVFGGPQEPTDG